MNMALGEKHRRWEKVQKSEGKITSRQRKCLGKVGAPEEGTVKEWGIRACREGIITTERNARV